MTDETQEHAVWSPSSSHRWRRCPGSINAERGLKDRVGKEAAEGTLFHDHADLCLTLGAAPRDFPIGRVFEIDGHKVTYSEEMVEHLEKGIAFVLALFEKYPDATILIEQKVDISPWTGEKGGKGTSDLCIVVPSLRLIIVFDWKYGLIPVSPVENDQETLYGLGCWQSFAGKLFDWDPTDIKVQLTIWQPRIPGGGGTWETTMEALLDEGEKIKQEASAGRAPDAPRIPGTKQCMYCKAAATCTELTAFNLEQYSLRFEDIEDGLDYGIEFPEPDIGNWSFEQMAYVYLHWKTFKRWHDRIRADLLQRYAEGTRFDLIKIVEGNKGRRKYRDADVQSATDILEEILGEKAYEKKLISPAVAEKLLGKRQYKKILADYVVIPPGKPEIVPVTDGREPMKTLGDKFDELFLEEDDEDD